MLEGNGTMRQFALRLIQGLCVLEGSGTMRGFALRLIQGLCVLEGSGTMRQGCFTLNTGSLLSLIHI